MHQIATLAAAILCAVAAQASGDVTSRADDAILEVVIYYARSEGQSFDCVLVSQRKSDNYVDLNSRVLQRLARRGIAVNAGTTCRPESTALWVGPIDRSGSRGASVAVGSGLPSISGHPAYVLRKDWLGRWRVVGVSPAE